MSEPVWMRLELAPAAALRELLAVLLVEWGASGVAEEGTRLTTYFVPEEQTDVEQRLREFFSTPGNEGDWHWQQETGEPWRDAWKEHFRPVQISPRLGVCPSWEAAPGWGPEVHVLQLDPGRAFGTGTHETTRLCLRLLDQITTAEVPRSCLDVGTGSGILALAAARLGISRTVALDIDPQAAAATRENALRNAVADQVLCLCGDLRAVRGNFPLVLANILYQILLGLAPLLVERVAPGGLLLLSGLLEDELASAQRVYGPLGMVEVQRVVDGEWGALLLRRG